MGCGKPGPLKRVPFTPKHGGEKGAREDRDWFLCDGKLKQRPVGKPVGGRAEEV